MHLLCSDLEGVFIPEIWINVAEKTGIKELRLTTRDISDYDVLMQKRLAILKDHGLKIQDIQSVITEMEPLEGAVDLLNWIRERLQVVIVSDTFNQFAGPLMKKMGYPTLMCHNLRIDRDGNITGYELRQKDGKRHVVLAFKSLYYKVLAMGDSYNDIQMLMEADAGILFCPPDNVKKEYPQFPVTYDYAALKQALSNAL
jgi:phosphoserine / homoserine phosphotransferase